MRCLMFTYVLIYLLCIVLSDHLVIKVYCCNTQVLDPSCKGSLAKMVELHAFSNMKTYSFR